MQCTDVMGVIAEKCVIIVICSVKLRVQAWHAFHIEGEGVCQGTGRAIHDHVTGKCSICE